jgi:hypothetical protein
MRPEVLIPSPQFSTQCTTKVTYLDGQVGKLVSSEWGEVTQAYCNLT